MKQAVSIVCIGLMLAFSGGAPLAAQPPQQGPQPPEPQQQPGPSPLQPLSPDQLANLVAPIALYPDALLSQVLVASTYPLELVEAGQWLQQNRNLQGRQLVDAARQQNWDPSIQALVVFPDVINRLNSDIRWTTDLGNAFLAQQADVMNAVQRLRAEARAAGKLNSNTQQTVTTQTQGGQTAIDIQPANPDVVYVPTYNPAYVWGPPAYGYYPPLYYPDYAFGFGFWPGIYIGGFFGGLGWGGWGWGPNWFGGSIFLNGFFFNHYGFHGYGYGFGGGGFGGRGIWAHNPEHRMGVAYPNRSVANRFGGASVGRGNVANGRVGGQALAGSRGQSTGRMNGGGSSSFANRGNVGAGASQARAGQWSHFGTSGSQQNSGAGRAYAGGGANRAAPSYGGSRAYGGNVGGSARTMPAYRSSPSSGSSGFRSAPSARSGSSFHGGGGGVHGGGGGSHGGGGGSHGGGGGSHGGGGGGSHGGGHR